MREHMARLLSVGLIDISLNADAAEYAGLRRTQSFHLEHVGTAQNFAISRLDLISIRLKNTERIACFSREIESSGPGNP